MLGRASILHVRRECDTRLCLGGLRNLIFSILFPLCYARSSSSLTMLRAFNALPYFRGVFLPIAPPMCTDPRLYRALPYRCSTPLFRRACVSSSPSDASLTQPALASRPQAGMLRAAYSHLTFLHVSSKHPLLCLAVLALRPRVFEPVPCESCIASLSFSLPRSIRCLSVRVRYTPCVPRPVALSTVRKRPAALRCAVRGLNVYTLFRLRLVGSPSLPRYNRSTQTQTYKSA